MFRKTAVAPQLGEAGLTWSSTALWLHVFQRQPCWKLKTITAQRHRWPHKMHIILVGPLSLCFEPHLHPVMSPNCFDNCPCFYRMLGLSWFVIDAGPPEAAALIFRTPYLSYECFIQQTQEHEGMADSCVLITAVAFPFGFCLPIIHNRFVRSSKSSVACVEEQRNHMNTLD